MKIEYIRINKDSWAEVKDSALTTVHKSYTDTQKEVSTDWKLNILKSEHSPIREIIVHAKFNEVPRFVADQLVRHHIGFIPYMSTMRPDRTEDAKPRNEQRMTDFVDLKFSANAQSIINISQERLCMGKVTKETRELWFMFLKELGKQEPELVMYCVPSCIYRCGCKEFKSCGYFNNFIEFLYSEKLEETIGYYIEYDDIVNYICDIYRRYVLYLAYKKGNNK